VKAATCLLLNRLLWHNLVVRKPILILFIAFWLCVVSFGTYYLMVYSNTPGELAHPSVQWPNESALVRKKDMPTLLLFGHPECPCTVATIGELDSLMAKVNGRLHVNVLFVIPKEERENWTDSSLERQARAVPGTTVLIDTDGSEAARFDAKTSGQVLLYDESGTLQFSGGLTSARGHAGDNLGKSVVINFVNERKLIARTTPVFGCALFEPAERKVK
jgi:hypothetical protein